MRLSVVTGSPGQQTGIDWKPFLGAWPPRRCGWLRRLVRKWAESVDRRGVCREWRAGPLARGHQCPFLRQAARAVSARKGCGSTASVRQVGSGNVPRAPGPEQRWSPWPCRPAPGVVPQLMDLLPVRCATSGVRSSAPGVEGLAQGLRALMPRSLRCSAGRRQRGHPVWRSRRERRSSEPSPRHPRLHSGQGLHVRLQAAAAKRRWAPFQVCRQLKCGTLWVTLLQFSAEFNLPM